MKDQTGGQTEAGDLNGGIVMSSRPWSFLCCANWLCKQPPDWPLIVAWAEFWKGEEKNTTTPSSTLLSFLAMRNALGLSADSLSCCSQLLRMSSYPTYEAWPCLPQLKLSPNCIWQLRQHIQTDAAKCGHLWWTKTDGVKRNFDMTNCASIWRQKKLQQCCSDVCRGALDAWALPAYRPRRKICTAPIFYSRSKGNPVRRPIPISQSKWTVSQSAGWKIFTTDKTGGGGDIKKICSRIQQGPALILPRAGHLGFAVLQCS